MREMVYVLRLLHGCSAKAVFRHWCSLLPIITLRDGYDIQSRRKSMNKNCKLNRYKSFLYMLSNFSQFFFRHLLTFLKGSLSKHLTGTLYRCSVGPVLGPNCLNRSAADDLICQYLLSWKRCLLLYHMHSSALQSSLDLMEAKDLTHDQNDLDYLYRLPKYISRWERADDKSRDGRHFQCIVSG